MLTRSAFAPRRQNSRRADEWKRCPGYLQWLRGRECFLSLQTPGHQCLGKVRACHFDPWGDKGMGSKVSDNASLPMCDGAHADQHALGWPEFQRRHNFDGRHVVTSYWVEWLERTPMGVSWAAKQEAA